ncbi:MAG: DUF4345 family protein [Phycisphaerales bacterium JB063]
MIAQLFLAFNGVLYIALAAWCTLAPNQTAAAIGFGINNSSAKSEYLTVYGGLELGMGLFFLLAAWRTGMVEAGLWFAALSYAALAVYRIITVVTMNDLSAFIYTVAIVEPAMALLSIALLARHLMQPA